MQADNQRARQFLDAVGNGPTVVHLGGGDLDVHLPVLPRRSTDTTDRTDAVGRTGTSVPIEGPVPVPTAVAVAAS